jgi:hypothetical protein
MKLSQIEPLKETLLNISQKELPFRLAYKISKLSEKIEKDYLFFTEEVQKIIIKYAERDEKGEIAFEGNNVKIQRDLIEQAEKDLKELDEVEIEQIDVSFTLDELENLNIKPLEVSALMPFIKE